MNSFHVGIIRRNSKLQNEGECFLSEFLRFHFREKHKKGGLKIAKILREMRTEELSLGSRMTVKPPGSLRCLQVWGRACLFSDVARLWLLRCAQWGMQEKDVDA